MKNQALVQFVIIAAIVLVMLPLFAAAAMIAAHFVFGMTGMVGIFGAMGPMEAAGFLWAALAVLIVGALIGLLVNDLTHA